MSEQLDYNIDISDTEFTNNEVQEYLDGDDDKSKFVNECAELMEISVLELLEKNADGSEEHRNIIALISEFGEEVFFRGNHPSDIQEQARANAMRVYETPYGEFSVGTEAEADKACSEYIEDSVWAFNSSFLSSYTGLPEEMFSAVQESCESANDAILICINRAEGGLDEFVKQAIAADGRGHFLAGYDHEERQQSVQGEWILMFRTN